MPTAKTTKPEPKITDEIQTHLTRYMAFADPDQPLIIALWTLHTWTFSDSFPRKPWTTPYLYVHSAQKQSGKTLLIDLLESLVLNPERTVDMSSSVLFRLIEAIQPTFFVDEADAIWSGAKNEALRGVLNGGYKHGGFVWRVEGGEPTKFRTFCPKLLAGIDNGQLPDTVSDRCIPIKLQRKSPDAKVEIYRPHRTGPEAEILTEKISAWVTDHALQIVEYEPEPIEGISSRADEIAMPLVQIAHALGIEKEAREAIARILAPQPEKDTPEVAVLRGIRDLFESEEGTDKLHTQVILDHLATSMDGGMTGKRLGNILALFDISGSNTMIIGNYRAKGYHRYQFKDAWERYL